MGVAFLPLVQAQPIVAQATAQTQPPIESEFFRISDVRTRYLTHTTKVVLDSPADTLKVYQAKPVQPSWFLPNLGTYLPQCDLFPKSGGKEATNKRDGFWFLWETESADPGSYTFTSKLKITVASRELLTDRVHVTWDQLAELQKHRTDADPVAILPDDLVQVARSIKSSTDDPLEGVRLITKWIQDNIRYDTTTVTYSPDDLVSTMKYRKGWCGHRSMVFLGLCTAAGIPCRRVSGFLTANQQGLWNGKEDWNRHGWAEIYLPKAGWVEVEPAATTNPFFISADYIKNPSELQSESVWVNRNGTWAGLPTYTDTIAVDDNVR